MLQGARRAVAWSNPHPDIRRFRQPARKHSAMQCGAIRIGWPSTTPARCLSPARCRSITGTTSSAIRRSPMPSSTASFIMLTGSTSPARACANGVCSNYPLDPATKGKDHPNDPQKRAVGWPTSDRKPGRLRIGRGGRLHIGMHGRLRRNPQLLDRVVIDINVFGDKTGRLFSPVTPTWRGWKAQDPSPALRRSRSRSAV
jgi:hypothetical protein